jgi:membrane protease YdiL (CAAX protease family)
MVSSATAPPSIRPPSRLRLIFIGQSGLRSGWRLIVFLALFVTPMLLAAKLLVHFVPQVHQWAKSQPTDIVNPGFEIFTESWQAFFLFLAAVGMSKIEKRSFSDYGLPPKGVFGRKFCLGLAVGLGGVSLLIALVSAFGGYSPGSLALGGSSALKYAVLWAVLFLLVGAFEEFLYRGYVQMTLAAGIGFWPAATILSAAFAAMHLSSPGEKWPGILMVFCYGLLAAFTLRRTGNLWFIVGLHAAWDWAHVFLFSVPIAGVSGAGKLLHSSLHGPRWLTGGSVGPDGSVFALVVLLAMALFIGRGLFPSGENRRPYNGAKSKTMTGRGQTN